MEKTRATCVVGLVATLAIAGCASAPPASRNAPTAVMDYPSQSIGESMGRRSVFKADEKAREKIEKAYGEAERAAYAYASGASRLEEKELPPGAKMPSKEEVEALRVAAEAAWQNWWQLLNDQIDRYDQFLQKYPENWYVRHRFAWFLADVNLNHLAAEEWQKVIEQEPRFPYAYNNLATLYNHMGRDKESIDSSGRLQN